MSGKFISIPGALFIIICFFLPWLSVSCNGQELGQVSGMELALGSDVVNIDDQFRLIDLDVVGGDVAWLVIPLTGIVGLLLGLLAFMNRENERGAGVGSLIFGILGLLVFGLEFLLLRQAGDVPGISISPAYGLWGSIVGLLLMTIGGLLMTILGGRTKTAVSPAPFGAPAPAPVQTSPHPSFTPPTQPGSYGGFNTAPSPTPFTPPSQPTVQGSPEGFGHGSGNETIFASDALSGSNEPFGGSPPTAPFEPNKFPPATPTPPPPPPPSEPYLPPTVVGLAPANDDEPTAAVPSQNQPDFFADIDSGSLGRPSFASEDKPIVPPSAPPASPNVSEPPPTIQAFPDDLPAEPATPTPTPFSDEDATFFPADKGTAPPLPPTGNFSSLFDDDETKTFAPSSIPSPSIFDEEPQVVDELETLPPPEPADIAAFADQPFVMPKAEEPDEAVVDEPASQEAEPSFPPPPPLPSSPYDALEQPTIMADALPPLATPAGENVVEQLPDPAGEPVVDESIATPMEDASFAMAEPDPASLSIEEIAFSEPVSIEPEIFEPLVLEDEKLVEPQAVEPEPAIPDSVEPEEALPLPPFEPLLAKQDISPEPVEPERPSFEFEPATPAVEKTPPVAEEPLLPPPPAIPQQPAPPPPLPVADEEEPPFPPPAPPQPVVNAPPPTVAAERPSFNNDPTILPQDPPFASSAKTEILQRFSETFATLVVAEGGNKGRQYRLSALTSIGRDGSNDVVISDTAMSGSHARIRQEDGIYYLYDLASTNGTFVYDTRTSKWERVYREPLEEGKQIKLGRTVLNFVMISQ